MKRPFAPFLRLAAACLTLAGSVSAGPVIVPQPIKTLSIICAYDGIPASVYGDDKSSGPNGPVTYDGKTITPELVDKAIEQTNPFIKDYSYGKAFIENRTLDVVIRVPYPLGSAEEDKPVQPRGIRSSHKVIDYVITVVRKMNINLDQYDGFIFFYPNTEGKTYGGLGGVHRYPGFKEDRGFVGMEADLAPSTIAHEVLHSSSPTTNGKGVEHADSWVVTDGNPLSNAGKPFEYGDIYDIMGFGQEVLTHPNPAYKRAKKWIDEVNIFTDPNTAGTSNTYRIYRFDHKDALGFDTVNPDTKLAIKIQRETNGAGKKRDFWIGYRRNLPDFWQGTTNGQGAYITFDEKFNSDSDPGPLAVAQALIDTQTPGTTPAYLTTDKVPVKTAVFDAALPVGKTLSDDGPLATRPNPIYITPIAQGGTSPADYLDVVVNIGPYPNNQAPVISGITMPPGKIVAGREITLTANASDPNGDPLAFYWEFTQPGSRPEENVSTASRKRTFAVGGSYTVKCTVSDMKGKEASATTTVMVDDALTIWTERLTPSKEAIEGFAALGNTVVAVSEHSRAGCVRSVDGINWTQQRIGTDRARSARPAIPIRTPPTGCRITSATTGLPASSPAGRRRKACSR